jgi:hypothetical protein
MSSVPKAPRPVDTPVGPKPRAQQTVGDMVRTLLVVGGFVLFLVVMVWRPWHHDLVKAVDWRPAASAAAAAKIVPVLGPSRLPKGWQATSARLDTVEGGRAWHLGFVTPKNEYAAVGVTNAEPVTYINGVMPGAVESGEVVIDNVTWKTYEVPGAPDHGILRTDAKGVTYAVYGTATYSELTMLLNSLRPIAS